MSVISIAIFEGECHLSSIGEAAPERLEFIITPAKDGFIRMGGITSPVRGGRAVFDLRLLRDGHLRTELILEDERLPMPTISKSGYTVKPLYPSAESYFSLIKREAALRARVAELEKTVKGLCDKVYGEPLFDFPLAANEPNERPLC